MIEAVQIGGLWLRTRGDCVEVLAEMDGKWWLILNYPRGSVSDGEISHIVEPIGISKSPPDPLAEEQP